MTEKRMIEAFDRIRLDPERTERIWTAAERAALPEKEDNMKTRKILRGALLAAILCVICAVTAYAITGIGRSTGTHPMANTGTYTSLNEIPNIEKTVGYAVTVPDRFENGYVFASAKTVGEADFDENNQVLREYYSVVAEYARPGSGTLTLSLFPTSDLPGEKEAPAPTLTREIDGVQVRYSLDHYKAVPEDYEKAAEDLAAEAAGHYYISFGTETEREFHLESADFTLDGVEYILMGGNGDGAEALFRMAAEVIDASRAK